MRDFDNAMVIAGTVTMTLVYVHFFLLLKAILKMFCIRKAF